MNTFSWKCPFCNQNATIKEDNCHENSSILKDNNIASHKELYSIFIVCPNIDCKKITLSVFLYNSIYSASREESMRQDLTNQWDLIPQSNAKVFPNYIPKPIVEDYNEACSILNLSSKASATLSRRCLQGMIRDYFGVTKNRLVDEISAIQEKVDPLTWKAIDAVRKIGNIGAHMEKDIDHIIDVDPNEAEILIKLIEQLIEDWYVLRHERNLRLSTIVSIAEAKTNQKGNN
jgi:hypothetical protein